MNRLFVLYILLLFILPSEATAKDSTLVIEGPYIGTSMDEFYFELVSYNAPDVSSLQLSMDFDADEMEFIRGDNYSLLGLGDGNINESSPGEIRVIWDQPSGLDEALVSGNAIMRFYFQCERPYPLCFSDPNFNEFVNSVLGEVELTYIDACTQNSTDFLLSWFECRPGARADHLELDLYVTNFTDINSMQFSITFEPSQWEFLDILETSPELDGFGEASFGISEADQGKLRLVWIDMNVDGETLPSDSKLFTLLFRQKDANASDIKISNDPLVTEIENIDGDELLLVHQTCSQPRFAKIEGNIFIDLNDNCQSDITEPQPKYWEITLSQNNSPIKSFLSREDGYFFFHVDSGSYSISATPYNQHYSLCNSVDVLVEHVYDNQQVELIASPILECPLMSVEITNTLLRRCFDNHYKVMYRNVGSAFAINSFVDVTLEENLSFLSADLPEQDLGNNTYRFYIGDIGPFDEGSFRIKVHLDCDSTVIGQTHCVEARIYPDSLCDLESPLWSGASVEVTAECKGDTVHFSIQNVGDADMAVSKQYIVVEDDISFFEGDFRLDKNQAMSLPRAAEGKTLRLIAEQEDFHPGASRPTIAVEGCLEDNQGIISRGEVTKFGEDDENPFIDIFCSQNRGSYDPNDKTGFPTGYGDQNIVLKNQSIDFLLRFQNTGTDTAFRVIIEDEIQVEFDLNSIQFGPSSHDNYTVDLEGRKVVFTFNDILLPDSSTNEELSHGFVQYSISPHANMTLGTVLNNNANIYFDYNEAVHTNTTKHTIGSLFITNVYDPINPSWHNLRVFPNPGHEYIQIDLSLVSLPTNTTMIICDTHGRQIRNQKIGQNQNQFQIQDLTPGHYCLLFVQDGVILSTTRIIKQ